MKKWNIVNPAKLKEVTTNDEIISILLKNRGLTKKADIENFLNPKLDTIDISDLNIKSFQLCKAFARIDKAIKNKESIVVYTDYDADGVCAGAIIWETLHKLGAKIMPYVPDRVTEGYGLSETGIDNINKEHAATLIIAVDHGVSAVSEIEYARKKGIEVIVIDHHLLPTKLPKPVALVHTTQTCAAGLTWIFTHGLRQWISTNGKKKISSIKLSPLHLELAALATVADLVPLIGINRIIVKNGLPEINQTKRPGLSMLIKKAGLTAGTIGVYEVGYILAPRINAAGRMANALDVLCLLCTRDEKRAEKLAQELHITNASRQRITQEETLHAVTAIKTSLKNKELGKLLFVSHKSYSQGVIGLIAGRLVEEFYRPAIVISEGIEYSKASARSISGFNIVEVIRQASNLLVSVGGHPMAAGFTVATSKLTELRNELITIAEKEIDESILTRKIKIDLEINLAIINQSLYAAIAELAPFGVGNPEPVFASQNAVVVGATAIGKDGKHLRLLVQKKSGGNIGQENVTVAIGFGIGDIIKNLTRGVLIDIAYTISENNWNGQTSLQLKLKDVKMRET